MSPSGVRGRIAISARVLSQFVSTWSRQTPVDIIGVVVIDSVELPVTTFVSRQTAAKQASLMPCNSVRAGQFAI